MYTHTHTHWHLEALPGAASILQVDLLAKIINFENIPKKPQCYKECRGVETVVRGKNFAAVLVVRAILPGEVICVIPDLEV